MSKYFIANWKMNLSLPEALQLGRFYSTLAKANLRVEFVVAPSAVFLMPIHDEWRYKSKNLFLAAQGGRAEPSGAFTGDVSIEQFKGMVSYCIVGHSERRRYHKETSFEVTNQLKSTLANDIVPIYCFSELTKSTPKEAAHNCIRAIKLELADLSARQVSKIIFAYEPVWAIGSGEPATPEYIDAVARGVRAFLASNYGHIAAEIVYGGSVNEDNASSLANLETINGVLVGGASLERKKIEGIVEDFGRK